MKNLTHKIRGPMLDKAYTELFIEGKRKPWQQIWWPVTLLIIDGVNRPIEDALKNITYHSKSKVLINTSSKLP